jgi:glycine/D-amino acid oxidase-like deaminating enzyme
MATEANSSVRDIVIVGGGSAGWITAGLLASEHGGASAPAFSVTLVESPDVRTIGVGEGTWPTMRTTLQKIGICEARFLDECAAAFKQGTKFVDWIDGTGRDHYYHPFTPPAGYATLNLVPYWQARRHKLSFVDAVSPQAQLCQHGLAPKRLATPEYAAVTNYAYHLDAGTFADLLKRHCIERLGVRHILDHVTGINGRPDEDIESLRTDIHGDISGDLFIDCTGFTALLIGRHYGIPLLNKKDILFNDSALACQVPYDDAQGPIASQTISTARAAGWIWDIGLTSRRGIGYAYSSAHSSDADAERVLAEYIEQTSGTAAGSIEPRKISFEPGHREKFWHRNAVAVGMTAGFLEPLEASALVLVELAARMISEELPANRSVMDIVAKRYNARFLYRWGRIIDFLKLHYLLSKRSDSDFWHDNRSSASVPDRLAELLELWRYHVPWHRDFPQTEEVFSSASHQYVLYGMGFQTKVRDGARHAANVQQAERLFAENAARTRQLLASLPTNRELLNGIKRQGRPDRAAS